LAGDRGSWGRHKGRATRGEEYGAVSKTLVKLLVVVLACVLLFPWILVNYVPWRIAVLEVVATALLGLAVLWYWRMRHTRRIGARLVACEFPGDVLLDEGLILLGAILLILPGVKTDVIGLLLLIPPVRWVLVVLLRRWNLAHARALREKLAQRRGRDS
jgi:UPF0716 protein FxsA